MMAKVIKGIMTMMMVATMGFGQVAQAMEQTFIDENQVMVIHDELAASDKVVKPAKVKTAKKAVKKIKKQGKWFGGFEKAKINKKVKTIEITLTLGETAKKHFGPNMDIVAKHAPKGWTINITGEDMDGEFNAAQVQNLDGKQVIVHDHVDNVIILFKK